MEKKSDELLQKFNTNDGPGTSVAVIRDGRIVFNKCYGLANLEEKIPVEENTNFRLASVTKQFTAMSIMILKERGLLSYNDPITKYFPGFPKIGEQITIKHLLTHTSGLVDYEDIIPDASQEQLKDRDVLNLLKTQHGTYFTPGTQYNYSNTGYALLALIVENVSGMDYATFLKKNIFQPLGMDNTIAYENGISTVSNRAYGYSQKKDGSIVFRDQSPTSAVLGDGGIYTSIPDYFKWDQALYGEKLVSKQTLEEAFTSEHLPDGSLTGYGFGWRIDERHGFKLIYHNGGTCGFSTAVRRVPERKLSLVLLTNLAQGNAGDIADEFINWLLSQSSDEDKE